MALACICYLFALALANLDFAQRWVAGVAKEALSDHLQTHVEIDKVRIGLFNRLLIDDVFLYDQSDSLMLKSTRIAAKVDLLPLLKGKVRINNAQLFGSRVHIYQHQPDSALNCQFVIDAFKRKDDTEKKPIDLQIGSIIIRRCQASFDQYYKPETPDTFNIHHLNVKNISVTASVDYLTPDSQSVCIKQFSFEEESGIELKNMAFSIQASHKYISLADFIIETSESQIRIPYLTANFVGYPNKDNLKEWIQGVTMSTALDATICPSDAKSFITKLQNFNDKIHLRSNLTSKNGYLQASDLIVRSDKNETIIEGSVIANNIGSNVSCHANITRLYTASQIQQFITRNLKGAEQELSPILSKLGATETAGNIDYFNHTLTANIDTKTQHGGLAIVGKLTDKNKVDATVNVKKFNLSNLLQNNNKYKIANLTLEAKIEGIIKSKDGKPNMDCKARIEQIDYNNYTYRNALANVSVRERIFSGKAELSDLNGSIMIDGEADLSNVQKHIQGNVNIKDFSPYNMSLTSKYPTERFSGNINTDLTFSNADDICGHLTITDPIIATEDEEPLTPGNFIVKCDQNDGERQIVLDNRSIHFNAQGNFRWKDIPNTFLSITHNHLPSIFKSPTNEVAQNTDINFTLSIQDTTLISKLANTSVKIPETAVIQGEMNNVVNKVSIKADVPQILVANQDLRHLGWTMESNEQIIQTSLVADRMTKGKPIAINLDLFASEDKLNTRMRWDNHSTPAQQGNIYVTGHLHKDLSDEQAILGMINASTITINDTIWTVSPSYVNYHDKVIDVENVRIASGNRHITLNGRVSSEETDTLTADLKEINLGYIFNLANFHAVEFDGRATGRAYAHSLFKKPIADIFLHVDDFTFNEAPIGEMDVYGNWGHKPKSITLSANIRDPKLGSQTSVEGVVVPGKNPPGSLEINVKTQRINIAFLNKYTNKFFRDLKGVASGWVRVFGQFKNVNIEGDLKVDDASTHVLALGVDYHFSGDSVILRPDNIYFRNATIYDPYGNPGHDGHLAIMNGHLMHQHLTNLSYNFSIEAHNMLGYNFNSFGDNNFYGIIYGTGAVELYGQPGQINVNVKCKPNQNSFIVYNATSPETITEAGFVTYVAKADSTVSSQQQLTTEPVEESTNDMRLNFDLDITPDAELRVLMDTKSGDFINLFGNSHIIANYYNKGKFQMYGTFRIDHGMYKMSVQDFIHKDFQIQPNGTIIFGGIPYQAALNLQAAYTVPNVSLDDLASSDLGLSNTRVNCIMNIGGKAREPQVTFDFELPNANEDEKQMIRSLISTEEEKNMQVIYLLGLGRFYSYESQYAGQGNQQSNRAMNSFLSNTLSNRVNQIMSNAMGTNSNWTFGTNLRTGENGWDQLDVEGLLSGRMLNNRLLINGNFGYRESMYNTNKSNFIGDFDIRYLLNARGTYSLKAYNQTNDRYFTQSSLTTQGIGIQYKRDFNNWKEAFRRSKKNNKKISKKKQ